MSKLFMKRMALLLIIAGLAVLLVILTVARFKAPSIGENMGVEYGSVSGKAAGSLEGMTVGQTEGFEAGKETGLRAEDTEAALTENIKATGKLQVLVASGTFSDILSVGGNPEKAKGYDYAALLSMKYNAVFSVDLTDIVVELKEDGLHVWLKQPAVEFFPVGDVLVKKEYQKRGFTGSAEAGSDAFNNSVKKMKEKAEKKLSDDKALMDAAKASAEQQMRYLVNAVSVSKPEVHIYFKD